LNVATVSYRRRIGIDAPNQLNALNLNIIDALQDALIKAEDDENIIGVWLEGMGDKGFCAGGDVRSLLHESEG
jgi:enoyl-CoA hydratase/carnithine racemase